MNKSHNFYVCLKHFYKIDNSEMNGIFRRFNFHAPKLIVRKRDYFFMNKDADGSLFDSKNLILLMSYDSNINPVF